MSADNERFALVGFLLLALLLLLVVSWCGA